MNQTRVKPSRGNFWEGQTLQVGICGTTEQTVQVAEKLRLNSRFKINWVVTPQPKPIGRKQTLTPNPLDLWARQNALTVYSIEKSLAPLKNTLLSAPEIDFLLVVDFGYLIPDWLLNLPKIAPINIHPSDLPQYRGSSPGQYALLYGDRQSAVCIMRMTADFDEGPIINRQTFTIAKAETAVTYYRKAFALAAEKLPATLVDYAVRHSEEPQINKTDLVVAKRFSRQDGYVSYSLLLAAKNGEQPSASQLDSLSPILREILNRQSKTTLATLIERAVRALSPWPGVWTVVPEYKGQTSIRQKILAVHLDSEVKLIIDRWQFEGETPQSNE